MARWTCEISEFKSLWCSFLARLRKWDLCKNKRAQHTSRDKACQELMWDAVYKKQHSSFTIYSEWWNSEKRCKAECDSAGTLLATIQPRVGGYSARTSCGWGRGCLLRRTCRPHDHRQRIETVKKQKNPQDKQKSLHSTCWADNHITQRRIQSSPMKNKSTGTKGIYRM